MLVSSCNFFRLAVNATISHLQTRLLPARLNPRANSTVPTNSGNCPNYGKIQTSLDIAPVRPAHRNASTYQTEAAKQKPYAKRIRLVFEIYSMAPGGQKYAPE